MKHLLTIIALMPVLGASQLYGQQLAVNVQAAPGVSVQTDGLMDFGMLLPGQGLVQIPLKDPRAETIKITTPTLIFGRRITIELSSPGQLRKGGNALPFTLKAAYHKNTDNKNNATVINGSSVTIHNLLCILGCKVYLYLYGDVNVGNLPAGEYIGTINVRVEKN